MKYEKARNLELVNPTNELQSHCQKNKIKALSFLWSPSSSRWRISGDCWAMKRISFPLILRRSPNDASIKRKMEIKSGPRNSHPQLPLLASLVNIMKRKIYTTLCFYRNTYFSTDFSIIFHLEIFCCLVHCTLDCIYISRFSKMA